MTLLWLFDVTASNTFVNCSTPAWPASNLRKAVSDAYSGEWKHIAVPWSTRLQKSTFSGNYYTKTNIPRNSFKTLPVHDRRPIQRTLTWNGELSHRQRTSQKPSPVSFDHWESVLLTDRPQPCAKNACRLKINWLRRTNQPSFTKSTVKLSCSIRGTNRTTFGNTAERTLRRHTADETRISNRNARGWHRSYIWSGTCQGHGYRSQRNGRLLNEAWYTDWFCINRHIDMPSSYEALRIQGQQKNSVQSTPIG